MKTVLFINIVLTCLPLVIQADKNIFGRPCCECAHGKTVDFNYKNCVNNRTCTWTCGEPVQQKCGPLFLDPNTTKGRPIVSSKFWTFNLLVDNFLRIPCKIQSNPEANVTWLFEGKDIYSYPDKRNHYNITTDKCGPVLTMRVVTSDNGSYTCLAQNAKGSGNRTFHVTVAEEFNGVFKPQVTDLSIDTEDHTRAYQGTTFNLSCQVNFSSSVYSIPLINFRRHGNTVRDVEGKYENFPRAIVNEPLHTRKLSLKNVTIKEEGTWSCHGIKNGIKGDSKSLYLKIVPCPAGYYCPWNESKKHECPYGTYSDGSTNVTYQCTRCPREYPTTKPHDYDGPAKSVDKCLTKDKSLGSNALEYVLVGIIVIAVLLVACICYRYHSQRRVLEVEDLDEFVLVNQADRNQ